MTGAMSTRTYVLLGAAVLVIAVAFRWPEIHAQFDADAARQLAEERRAEQAASDAKAAAARERAAETERLALAKIVCRDAVRGQTKYPSKADFDPGLASAATVGRLRSDQSVIGVRGQVELMNGFGAMIPHRYGCDVKDGAVIRIVVEPG